MLNDIGVIKGKSNTARAHWNSKIRLKASFLHGIIDLLVGGEFLELGREELLIILQLADLYAQNTCAVQESPSSLTDSKPIGKTFYNNS